MPCSTVTAEQYDVIRISFRQFLQKDVHAHCIAIRHDKKASLTGQRLYRSVGIAILSDMVTGHAGTYPFLTPAVFRLVYPSKSSLILKHQADFLSTVENFQILYRSFNFFEAAISSSLAFLGCLLRGITFRQVQRIMELKDPHGEYSRYPYYDTNFICPICGKRMIPQVMHTQVKKRAICCFGEDGCQGYSIKTYLVDAALLEAYNTLEVKGCKKSAAWKRMMEIKGESPRMESVQYYWLDDLVERVEFRGDEMCVFWKCGLESEVPLNIPKAEEPTHVAELYRSFLGRLQSGDYRPARPNSTRERMLAEAVHGQQNNAVREAAHKGKRPNDLHRASAMRAAQNLKIKRMKGSAVSDC